MPDLSTSRIVSDAMLIFRDRLITVRDSPLHTNIIVVELATDSESFEGGVKLSDIVHFTGLLNLRSSDVRIREQGRRKLELWLYMEVSDFEFDEDPTPVQVPNPLHNYKRPKKEE